MQTLAVAVVALAAFAFADELCKPLADGSHDCPWVEPAWVKLFSEGAAGAPEQLWINYGSTPDVMVIGWLTSDMSAASTVQYGTQSGTYTNTATGNSTFYVYSSKYTSGLIHHVRLTGLAPATQYFYRVGQPGSWSDEYSFTSNNVGPNVYPYTLGLTADVGENDNANATITHLLNGADSIDSLIIAGDISYASGCESSGCIVWDAFQRMASPLAAIKPWAVNIGNHETYDTANGIVAISTKYRFNGQPTPTTYTADGVMYYSYETGPAHIISVSSFYPGGFSATSAQTVWLKSDLAKVDRTRTPWLFVIIHAPWYNSNTAHQGDGEAMRVAYEPLFIDASVDAVFAGHVHSYERVFPVNNKQVVSTGIPHFNIGDGGADLYVTWESKPAWSAYRSAEWGHGELQIQNATHAYWTWHRNADGETVVTDSTWVLNTQ